MTTAALAVNPPDQDSLDVTDLRAVRSLAPATLRAYGQQLAAWARWCAEQGGDSLPATPARVEAYLSDRARYCWPCDAGPAVACPHRPSGRGLGWSSLRLVRAAIGWQHRAAGFDDPTADTGLRQTMAVLARRLGRAQRQAAPLTASAEGAVLAVAGQEAQRDSAAGRRARRDIALVLVMRDALLRRSEVVALTWADLGPSSVTVTRSKTDQEAEGSVLYLSPAAVRALDAWRTPDAQPGERIFPISPGQVRRILLRRGEAAGVAGLSGHSPRVGMAQDLAASGAELPALMTAGRWRSHSMPARYTAALRAERGAVARFRAAQPALL